MLPAKFAIIFLYYQYNFKNVFYTLLFCIVINMYVGFAFYTIV